MRSVCFGLAVVALGAMVLGGCGEFGLTRPSYGAMSLYGYPSDNRPPDVAQIVKRFPELKGLVLTAPEYNAELRREAAEKPPNPSLLVKDEYIIQPGVTLNIEVIGEPEFTRQVTVQIDGSFDYPYVGQIEVKGLKISDLKSRMVEKLKKYLRDPQVVINAIALPTVFGTDSHIAAGKVLVIVAGQSSTPAFTGQETLAGLLTLANGFGPTAERREIRVIKPRKGHRRARIIISDMQALFMFGDMEQDIPMEVNDIVYVPEHWTAGDQFTKDWGLALQYLNQALSTDQLIQQWKTRLEK